MSDAMAPELCDVLRDFRQDLDAFFRAQKKHNSTRQRLQDVYLRLLRASPPAEPGPVGPVGPVGIAGVGKSSESPESKGSKAKRQAISLQELGGEALIRELLVAFLAEQRQVSQQEIRQSMQDVWVDEIGETFARVSVLFSKPKPECTQLALYRSGTRWQVAHAMQDEESLALAGAVPRHLEASRLLQETLQAADARSPRSKDSKAAAASETEKHVRPMPKKLVGKSPFFRPKDVSKLFEEIDADGDGQLSREDLLPYLRDYLGFGHAEVLNFLEAHRSSNSGVDLAAFKRGLKELNPYAVHNRDHKLIVRKPHAFGGIEGVDFHLEDCTGCTCLICDRSEEFKVDALTNCRVLIGPCSSSTFIRNCENCTFWVATKQFRVRDCSHCTFYVHCHTEPVIEASKDLRIAPFHATYPGLKKQFQDAGFEAKLNFWNAVYDFTGNSKHANWSIPALDECEKLVVTFEGSDEIPEEATPELTQELLVADPLESSESHGQSVASVPQTRPQAPASASPKRLRRCISDAAQEISGRLEAVMLSEREVTHSKMLPKRGEEVERPEKKADTVEEVEILDMDENLERPQQAKDLALGPTGPGTGCLGSSKARAAAWSTPGAGEPPNRSRPLGGLRLMSGGAAAEAETKPKRCKNCDNTGIHFLGKTCTCPFGKKILNDSSDEDMIFAPRAAKGSSEATGAMGATAKASSAAARQKIGEKIGVLMSSLDSDEEPLDPPAALSERQRRLLKEGLAGLGVARISNRAGDASSSEEEIIVEDEVPAVPAIPLRAAATPGSESTSESDDDAFLRWQDKTSRATSRNAAISD